MPNIELHPDYLRLKNEYEEKRIEFLKVLSRFEDLDTHTRKNLQSKYMMTIGQHELELLERATLYERLKRKQDLIRAQLNRKQCPDLYSIDRALDRELKDHYSKIGNLKRDLKASKRRGGSKFMSDSLVDELRRTYLNLAKQFHPDLNTRPTNEDSMVWYRVQKAYQLGDLESMRNLAFLYDESGNAKVAGTIPGLKNDIRKLNLRIDRIYEKIYKIKQDFPFNQESIISDPESVSERIGQIKRSVRDYNHAIKVLEEGILEMLINEG